MLEAIWEGIAQALGLGVEDLGAWQMALRALVVYIATLLMVRLGEKRFLGKNTAFDIILGIILGSVVSRAINGSAPFFPTLVAGFVLVGLHWLFSVLSFRSDHFGTLIKGSTRTIVKDGEIMWTAMRKSHLSKDDLLGALRTEASISAPEEVKEARLERSGKISVIRHDRQAKVVETFVADGVQIVRIEIE